MKEVGNENAFCESLLSHHRALVSPSSMIHRPCNRLLRKETDFAATQQTVRRLRYTCQTLFMHAFTTLHRIF